MRTEVLQIRISKEEKELFKKEANKLGLGMEGFIKQALAREVNFNERVQK